ncbi:MAG: putative ATPase, partial [halophilic archaeon J07HB67]
MSEQTETITVADVSAGPGGASNLAPGTPISLPVVEILTGRGFITGKSGSGKSNTASVVIENLLDDNFPVLIVDSDGEYYGLKEEYEILHAGADEECDIQVGDEHAEKLAGLALEQNVPIVLDVSGFLDEDVANKLVRETARQLFVKEKKLKKPFLMLVEECHEYIPEGAGLDDTGRTLVKIGKRGRKHGLGIVGISQRPADVKKEFITQCDWLCWHRLTWDNDTKVVERILGTEYGAAIEEADDGEAFLMTDWAESIRRVQFHRKQTFDAGATPGLEDFERPDLKNVSGDLVSELQEITDEQHRRESELAELRQELEEKRRQIRRLERELEEARDMSEMADQFAQAMLQRSGGDGTDSARARLDRFADTTGESGDGDESATGGTHATADESDVTAAADGTTGTVETDPESEGSAPESGGRVVTADTEPTVTAGDRAETTGLTSPSHSAGGV